jgi:hypothetical protein
MMCVYCASLPTWRDALDSLDLGVQRLGVALQQVRQLLQGLSTHMGSMSTHEPTGPLDRSLDQME